MRSKIARRILIVLGGLLAVVVIALGAVFAISRSRLTHRYSVTVPTLAIPSDETTIARGRHLVVALAKCADCHGENLGGRVFIDAPPFRLVARNLTRGQGGVGARMSDKDWIRAIRYGIGRDGRALFMPSEEFNYLTQGDLAAIIAYAKSVPPVDNVLPDRQFRLLGRILMVAGKLPPPAAAVIDLNAPFQPEVPRGPSVDYGRYLAQIGGCMGCHGPGLSGGPVPGVPPDFPPAANITPAGAVGQWTETDFIRALREGKRPNGSAINPFMPWKATAQMTDDEIHAVWLFLRSVPVKPYGNR